MPKIFRFSLLDSKSDASQEIQGRLEHILNEYKQVKVLRSSIDVESENKTVSILVDNEQDDLSIKNQLSIAIQTSGISCEMIEDPEFIPFFNDEILDGATIHKAVNNKLIKGRRKYHQSKINHKHDHDKHHDLEDHEHEDDDHDKDHNHHHNNHKHWRKGIIGALWGIGLLTISVLSLNIPAAAYYCITGATALMTVFLGSEVYSSAAKLIKSKTIGMSTLYTISTLVILGVSIASLFIPGMPLMFEAAPLVLAFWHIGEAIEHSLKEKVVSDLNMRDCAPKKIELVKHGIVSVKKLIPNDIIIVRKGQVIPVDGVCLEDTELFTTKYNGSPFSQEFKRGAAISAGMRLADNIESVKIRVGRTFQKSYLSRVADNIKQANYEKAPIEILTKKILKYFVPGLLCTAVISGIVIGCVFNPALAIQCAISVLVSACPCALSLVTPLAVRIGMSKAAEHGVNFKNGKTLQAASDIDTIVFDLNGTLTEGKPRVTEYKIINKTISEEAFLQYVALLESYSTHHIATVIRNFVSNKNLPNLQAKVSDIVSDHSGIKANINGEIFFIGNSHMLAKNGIIVNNPAPGSVYLVRGTDIIGQLTVTDPLRSDAKKAIDTLKALGKGVHICTGADKNTALLYAEQLGISEKNICANCVATESADSENKGTAEVTKTSYINRLKMNHKVAMIGDAANDVIAITKSDFGIAIKSDMGDEITQEQAGAVIQHDSLMPVVTAFEVSKQTKSNIFQNLIVSLTYNSSITLIAAGLFIALGFSLNPAIGIALMVIETTIVLLNAYRFRQQGLVQANAIQNHYEQPLNSTHHRLNAFGLRPGINAVLKHEKEAKLDNVVPINKGQRLFSQKSANSVVNKNGKDEIRSEFVYQSRRKYH